MKVVLLAALFLLGAHAQPSTECTVFNEDSPPPTFGDFGTCKPGVRLKDGESCSIVCTQDGLNTFNLVGEPYHCNGGNLEGGPQRCIFQNYVYGKKNCSVSQWSSSTPCTFQCGDAWRTRSRTVISYGEAGGQPCPVLSYSSPCQNQNCQGEMEDAGYYHWGPFCAGESDREIKYWFYTFGNRIDWYIFDETNFNRYTWDASLAFPQNAYYYPVFAYLNTYYETSKFVVPAGKCYMVVMDNTKVGAAKGNNGEFNEFGFWYQFNGVTSADGFKNYARIEGTYQPASAPSRSSVSFFGAMVTLVAVLLLKLD